MKTRLIWTLLALVAFAPFGGIAYLALADEPAATATNPVLDLPPLQDPAPAPALDPETLKQIQTIGTLIATKQWALLFPVALMLLAGLLKRPFALALLERVPSRFRALAVTVVGAVIGVPSLMAFGLSPWLALLISLVASLAAPGAYAVWQGATSKPTDAEARLSALEAQVSAAKRIKDPAQLAEAVRALGNAV